MTNEPRRKARYILYGFILGSLIAFNSVPAEALNVPTESEHGTIEAVYMPIPSYYLIIMVVCIGIIAYTYIDHEEYQSTLDNWPNESN